MHTFIRRIFFFFFESIFGASCDILEQDSGHCKGHARDRQEKNHLVVRLKECYGGEDLSYLLTTTANIEDGRTPDI